MQLGSEIHHHLLIILLLLLWLNIEDVLYTKNSGTATILRSRHSIEHICCNFGREDHLRGWEKEEEEQHNSWNLLSSAHKLGHMADEHR